MAMKIKFPLKMPDGAEARTIEELREHFDLATVLSYYSNGRLAKWLEDRYYDDEAKKVAELSSSSDDLGKQICDILGVAYSEDTKVDVGTIFKNTDKHRRLKEFTSDDNILAAADRVAFTQEDLNDLINGGVKEIYLCGEHFTLPANIPDVTYIGVNMPMIEFNGDSVTSGIDLKNVKFNFDIEKYLDEDNDEQEAVKWYRLAAEQGIAEAQYTLGKLYEDGDVIPKNAQEAKKWYRLAAEQGDHFAAFKLEHWKEEDTQETVEKLRLDAERYVANWYASLEKVDIENGLDDFAVKKEVAVFVIVGQEFELGLDYFYGRGVKQDYGEAVKHFRSAALKKHYDALYHMGLCYQNGTGVEQNIKEAAVWYRLASSQGTLDDLKHVGAIKIKSV